MELKEYQVKALKQVQQYLEALLRWDAKNEQVVKAAGVEDPEITVEIADNVQVKILKATLTDVRAKGEPVADKA